MHGNGPLPRSYGTHGNASRHCSTSQQDMPSPIAASAHHGDSFLGAEDPYLLSDGVRKGNDVHRKGKVACCPNSCFILFVDKMCFYCNVIIICLLSQINDGRLGRGSETRETRVPKDPEKLEIQRKKVFSLHFSFFLLLMRKVLLSFIIPVTY